VGRRVAAHSGRGPPAGPGQTEGARVARPARNGQRSQSRRGDSNPRPLHYELHDTPRGWLRRAIFWTVSYAQTRSELGSSGHASGSGWDRDGCLGCQGRSSNASR
jgi:hypothetical protein